MKHHQYPPIKDKSSLVRESQSVQFHKTRYIFFPQTMNQGVQARIEKQLQQAIDQRQIQVFLQPRVRLENGCICAAEALARWKWPDGSWCLPAYFLPALEQTGLISQMDFYMLEQVAELQQNWRRQNIAVLPVSVNFSAATLLQPDFTEKLEHIRLAYGVLAGQIEIEVTEHCFMKQQQALVPILQQIRQKEFPVCLDDFGVGSSSLAMLMQLPVDYVKLDKSFLEQDITDRKIYDYIGQIIKLLHAAEARIVVEGVETAEHARLLQLLQVEQGQGWYWERPLHWQMFLQKYMLDKTEKRCYSM